jgi:hypothetical protein
MKLYKVENHPDLVKDMESKAVLNNNFAALSEYRKKQQMQREVESLKEDVRDIKFTLDKILSLLNK